MPIEPKTKGNRKVRKSALRAVRLEPADAAQIEDISLVLGLSSGEFLRRSIRVGIKALRRARLPGSPVAGPVQREQLQLNLKEGK